MSSTQTTILVIDDDEAVRLGITFFLEDYDYLILTAENGRAGVDLFEERGADLVLVDLRMPEMDGLEVLAHISQSSPDTPLIVISGTGVITDAVEALHNGAWDYLLKPIQDSAVLVHAVEKALEKARLKNENARYQQRLEQIVDERTRELRRTAAHLIQFNDRLKRIVDTTRRLSTVNEMGQFCSRLLDEFGWHMQATEGFFYINQADGLHLRHAMGLAAAPEFMPFPLPERSLFQEILETGKSILTRNDAFGADSNTFNWKQKGATSALAFPLSGQPDGVFAIMVLYSGDSRMFTEQDLEIGNILASYGTKVIGGLMATQSLQETRTRLQQAEKLEALGTLAGGIAHDFNNILSSILGFSQLIQMDLPRQESEIGKNIAQVIKAGLRAKDLVQHMLTFSRHSEIARQPIQIHPLIKEAVKFLRATFPAAIEIQTRLKAEGTMVMGDATQIHQVLINLCTNAAHAMKNEGGVLTISLEKSAPETQDADAGTLPDSEDVLVLTISDTGEGIPAENVQRIFDPFFTTKKRGEGTGMGLPIVYGIVQEMEGSIRVESEPGKGSMFEIRLPACEGQEPIESDHDPQGLLKGKGRILLVDDEKGIVRAVDKLLTKIGYQVIPANGSVTALEWFESASHDVDLIITDFDMPEMNGLDFSRRVLDIRPEIPIILCTGFSKGIGQDTLREVGIYGMLMKPIIFSELADLIGEALK